VRIDTWTGLEASAECGDEFTEEVFALNVDDVWGIKWITQTSEGRNWAENLDFDDPILFSPNRKCKASDPRPKLEIVSPEDDAHLDNQDVEVIIIADATANFREFVLEWADEDSPRDWEELDSGSNPRSNPSQVATLNLNELPRGPILLRLTMWATNGGYAEVMIKVFNDRPEPTPAPSPTKKPTRTPSSTPQPTETPTDAPPTETPAPTDTPAPSETPTAETPTESPTPSPTAT
jgi:hypothetical protein